ncbi:hypothetical protein SASPL_117214 [Salvia splendens]|uniref:LOB domain-containing protein n=1 Tax=Salvia splendens TaxID=180675 RepID=A0A8X8ZW36_SALSN|nr:hypothetical protein SASPL_117214 [Salvia splendens]
MQAPEEEVHGEVHVGTLLSRREDTEFQAVHKVFGVSNVTKIITSLREEDRKVAVDSLVWEALGRQKDPVLGPFGDYRRVCEELRLYKSNINTLSQDQSRNA